MVSQTIVVTIQVPHLHAVKGHVYKRARTQYIIDSNLENVLKLCLKNV